MHPTLLRIPMIALFLAVAVPAGAQEMGLESHDWLSPSADGAVDALNASPRHGEWVMVRLANGDSVRSWVVYPERSDAGAVPFYGSSPDEADLARVSVPVLGHYGGDDAWVNASIPRAVDALGANYRPNIYDGAGHGFLRQQSGRDGANHHAAVQAWPMTVGFFQAAAYYASGAGGG
jgi:hypothetical protein